MRTDPWWCRCRRGGWREGGNNQRGWSSVVLGADMNARGEAHVFYITKSTKEKRMMSCLVERQKLANVLWVHTCLGGLHTTPRNVNKNRNKNTRTPSKRAAISVLICEQDHPKREQIGDHPIRTDHWYRPLVQKWGPQGPHFFTI